jgi:hypothetical protein
VPLFWEKNIVSLKKSFPALAERLEQFRQDDTAGAAPEYFRASVGITGTASGEVSLKINGVLAHSARDPRREARRLADAALHAGSPGMTVPGAVIILGFGLGYSAEEAARIAPEKAIVIVEKRLEIFCAALGARDFAGFFEKKGLVLVLGADAAAINTALSLVGTVGAVILNKNILALDGEWARETGRAIETWKNKDAVNEATLRRFGKRWVRNLGANLDAIRDLPGTASLSGRFPFPVFLAAAGPSLDGIKPHLTEIYQRCVIVACDTALRFLERADVHPDFTVSVDPQYWNARHLDRTAPEKTCLIAESSVYPSVLRGGGHGRQFLCSSFFPPGAYFERAVGLKGALGAGGSVATSAWDFARLLQPRENSNDGVLPLFTVGLDLAFPRYKTHFKGAFFEERTLWLQNRLKSAGTYAFHALRDGQPFTAPAAGGGVVLTDRRLSLYARWFESHCAGRAYNYSLSREGLLIKGFTLTGIETILALPKCRAEIDIYKTNIFTELDTNRDNEEAQQARIYNFNAAKKNIGGALKELCGTAHDALRIVDNETRNGVKTPERIIFDKLEKANDIIKNNMAKDIAGFLFPRAEAMETEAAGHRLESHANFYRAIIDAAEFNLRALFLKQDYQ